MNTGPDKSRRSESPRKEVSRAVPTVVTVEAPVGVADGSLCAVVPELLCTHLAALTAVCDEADPQRAAGRGRRTRAWPLAELGA